MLKIKGKKQLLTLRLRKTPFGFLKRSEVVQIGDAF